MPECRCSDLADISEASGATPSRIEDQGCADSPTRAGEFGSTAALESRGGSSLSSSPSVLTTIISARLPNLSEEQLSEVLFAINAVSAGIQTCHSKFHAVVQENQRLKTENLSLQNLVREKGKRLGATVLSRENVQNAPVSEKPSEEPTSRSTWKDHAWCKGGCGRFRPPAIHIAGKPYCQACAITYQEVAQT